MVVMPNLFGALCTIRTALIGVVFFNKNIATFIKKKINSFNLEPKKTQSYTGFSLSKLRNYQYTLINWTRV